MSDHANALKAFQRLLIIMDELREKCPWDKAQTFDSLRTLTIEEVYELADAIAEKNAKDIQKELGDVLLHIVFYAKIASETQRFDMAAVCQTLCDKLVQRHPHVYGDTQVSNVEEVKKNWERLKLKQETQSVLQGVPKSLPAMIKAQRIQEKAAGIGFDWEAPDQVFQKVKEELSEFEAERRAGHPEKAEKEFGDLLFSLINYARHIGINPENALEATNKKFISRFAYIETHLGKPISEAALPEMDALWSQAKSEETP